VVRGMVKVLASKKWYKFARLYKVRCLNVAIFYSTFLSTLLANVQGLFISFFSEKSFRNKYDFNFLHN
jgi:hypothetical protein